jgi:hypothetical protein
MKSGLALRHVNMVTVLLTNACNQAVTRFLEFFAAPIQNRNARRAYARSLTWCERQVTSLRDVQPVHVAARWKTPRRSLRISRQERRGSTTGRKISSRRMRLRELWCDRSITKRQAQSKTDKRVCNGGTRETLRNTTIHGLPFTTRFYISRQILGIPQQGRGPISPPGIATLNRIAHASTREG